MMNTKYHYYSRQDYTLVSRVACDSELLDCSVRVYSLSDPGDSTWGWMTDFCWLGFPDYQCFTDAERQEAYIEFTRIREDE